MASLFLWWAVLLGLGLAAFPVSYVLLGRFPDRGYLFSKVIALLLVGYFSWILGHVSFGTPVVAFSILLTLLLSGIILWSWVRKPFLDFLKGNVAFFFVLEFLFFLAFLVAGAYKLRTSGIVGTEKPMDFAFLNGILASTQLPPNDPWLAGGSISYYYFGYFILACLTKITGVTGGVAYNLGVALLWALAFSCAFSLVYALTRRYRYSLFSAFALAILGNLDYWHRAVQSWSIGNLRIPYYNDTSGAVPGGFQGAMNFLFSPLRSGWDYFQASRIIPVPPSDKMINEFPSFSFFLSDLHPHLMAIPFVLLAMGLSFNILKSPLPGWRLFGGSPVWRVLQGSLVGLVLGGLSFLNSWDFPTFTLLFGCCLLLQQVWVGEGDLEDRIKDLLLVGAPIVLSAFLFYLPFYLKLQSQAQGLGVVSGGRTGIYHFVVIFGLFLAVLVPVLVGKAFGAPKARSPKGKRGDESVCMVCGQMGSGKKFCGICGGELAPATDQEVQAIPAEDIRSSLAGFTGWFAKDPLAAWGLLGGVLLVLIALELLPVKLAVFFAALLLMILAFLGLATKTESKEMVFATLLVWLAFLLVAFCEVFYMRDLFAGALYRMNTVFKFHYQVWILLAVASGPFLKWTFEAQWPSWGAGKKWAWGTVAGFALLGASLYPVLAFSARAVRSNDPITMDGAVFYERTFPTDHQAALWLIANAKPAQGRTPVILEAWGGSYHQEYGRLATLTGFPTVLGWDWHEVQWRGSGDKRAIRGGREEDTIQRRQADIDAIYTGQDAAQARDLLAKYGVQYLYVGGSEREKYKDRTGGFEKFPQVGQVVWQSGDSLLYRVGP